MSVNKYHARKTACRQQHEHDSKKEASWCNDLTLLERSGAITHLEQQPQFWFDINGQTVKHPNGRRVGYQPDFSYRDVSGRQIALDVKGMRTEAYVLRAAIFRALFPYIELKEV